jgi:nucleotide-binding universal stress UspA family protein
MNTLSPQRTASPADTVFGRIVVGVDGSDESLEAAWEAAVLAQPEAPLTLVAAWHTAPHAATSMPAPPTLGSDEEVAREAAEAAMRVASSQFPSARGRVLRGLPAYVLLDEIRNAAATLVAVGTHGRGRAEGIVFGSTATSLVHSAPCSVLVARARGARYPQRVAVGVDGSPESAHAYAAARHVAERFGAELAVVVAEGDRLLDLAAVSAIVGERFHVVSEEPVRVLTAAAADSDLLVVGSRGLRGLRALGSVSERVAHAAACSTLVVR